MVALVLSQTVFRSVLDDDDDDAYTAAGDRTGEGQSEYIPDEEDPDLAPPPPEIFTQAPTTNCTIPDDYTPAGSADPGTIRGGDLQYTIPDGWDFPWGGSDSLPPYMTETDGQGRNVEGNWYSVVSLGKVVWPEDEGGYQGARADGRGPVPVLCDHGGRAHPVRENPTVTDYRSETIDVDGHSGWIVQATYHFEDPPDSLSTTSASIVTSIVVETDDGPSALVSDVAADHEDHVQNLEDIIASLEVVG